MRTILKFIAAFLICCLGVYAWTTEGRPDDQAEAVATRACEKTHDPERWTRPSADEIKRRLTPEQYEITQEEGTEPPFRNPYWDNKEQGIYVDVVSGEPLFSSREKYDSGTGWPSFSAPLEPMHIVEKTDRKLWMVRTELRSKHADSHLGHVFDDGPAPTGLRYCINSAALRFVPAEDLEKEGYGDYASLFAAQEVGQKGVPHTELATFGMGCFWGAEAAFCAVEGVIDTEVGYAGGRTKDPSYQNVSTGRTGHAEVVQVRFDPARVSYQELLEVFWAQHDPTTLDRQGSDVGTQYRSLILFHTPEQAALARTSKENRQENGRYSADIVTRIEPAKGFYAAEDYHQRYLEKRGRASCSRF